MKLLVLIPTHCQPDILRLTLFSLVKHLSVAHDLNIHLGVHSNYRHYSSDFTLFNDPRIRKLVSGIHLVDEIDWQAEGNNIYRYSIMHARNIANLFLQTRYYDYDYVLLIDNDVFVKADFVTEAMKMASQACFGTERDSKVDLIGTYFEDASTPRNFTNFRDGETILALPKVSVWHLLISRKLAEEIINRPDRIFPKEVRDPMEIGARFVEVYGEIPRDVPIFLDTFVNLVEDLKRSSKWKTMMVPCAVFSGWAHHFFCSSFNYGEWALGAEKQARVDEIVSIFQREFGDCGLDKIEPRRWGPLDTVLPMRRGT